MKFIKEVSCFKSAECEEVGEICGLPAGVKIPLPGSGCGSVGRLQSGLRISALTMIVSFCAYFVQYRI